ncbi:hypothetical protein BBK36DRAFT_20942 [Trichoderma citrinoviride]|uniref:Extracellular membrane protein CFEM domain-containing protein n=1 Tax=Trichoderma citrinoviride TaxID=58853 RepID=A0A2T4B767_9HYPO|nr:hypothetical protein BBK36DRAFT_20942 [Trichoderma citrinoviride]PTB65128.1 hypothetical protein BBK36DRAFT_20942 [Trichoderma citrinoviride]
MASLAHFALTASAAAGAHLSLSSFQVLTTSVPVQCLYAYNMPIQRCTPADFIGGGSCSQSCRSGLQASQFTVRGLCSGVNAPANSLLKEILEGHILDVLCDAGKAPTPTPTPTTPATPPKQTPPNPAPAPPPSPVTTTNMAPRPIFSTLSTSTVSTQSTSSSPLPETSTSTTTSAASSTSTETQASTTSEAAPSSSIASTTDAPSSETPQPSNNSQASSSSSSSSTTKPKPTRPPNSQPGSGGGSPFDFVPASRAAKLGLAGGSLAIAMAIASTTSMLL